MTKKDVAVVIDSTAALPPDIIKEHDLHIIPQVINWGTDTYLDSVDITPSEFYEKLQSSKELPTTSQPSVGQFHELFSKLAHEYRSILGIFISEGLSGTVASATSAAKMMPDFHIEIIDSRSVSMALGFIILHAVHVVEQGMGIEAGAKAARDMIPKAKAIFVVDTLEYLHRGGRIGGAKRLMGSMLSIKPVLHIDDGRIEPLASIRTKRKALDRTLELAAEDISGREPVRASIVHSSALNEAERFKEKVLESIYPAELMIAELSPAVGVHVGPGVVGLTYYVDD